MAFERIAEQRIREAVARGEFDNLPGEGQPIDLEEYFRTPEAIRMAYSILRSARCVPEEIELMKEVRALEDALTQSALRETEARRVDDRRGTEAPGVDDETRGRLRRRLRDRRLQLAMALERLRARRG